MIRSLGTDWFARLRGSLLNLLLRRVVWITSDRRDLADLQHDALGWVAIIGREHYEQSRRKYPIRNWRDLRSVVLLEHGQSPNVLFSIGPLHDDYREVTVYKFLPSLDLNAIRSIFWIPESRLLLGARETQQEVVTVDRHGLRYFMAPDGQSLISGGAIQSPEIFALAAGVSSPGSGVVLRASDLPSAFAQGLRALKPADWLCFLSTAAITAAARVVKPALLASTILLVTYMVLVSTYLSSMESWRARQLDDLGPEVTTLLAKQRAVDVLMAERNALVEVVRNAPPAWPIWEPVAAVWKAGGAIYSVNLSDRLITIRCSAAVATDVLKALQALKQFKNVQFDSAVRQGGVGQEFVVTLERVSDESSQP